MIMTRIKVQSFHLVDYIQNDCSNPSKIILLLHGYGESSQKIFKRLIDYLPKRRFGYCTKSAISFPLPTDDGYKISFAWYFFDNKKGEFFIDYDLPSELLKNLFIQLKLKDLPLTIIGYSQGGYLAPFVGEKIPQTKHVIGINCRFRFDKLQDKLNFKIDAIHGEQDESVDPIRAKESFGVLKDRGASGDFYILKNEGHRLTLPFREKIRELIG